jgi:hypothetical protein
VPKVKIIERPRADAPGYLRKAEQFCTAAAAALAADHYDAAMLDAVHAGISSADAVCVGLGGRRSADPDHMRAADLLETVGANSPPIAGRLTEVGGALGKGIRDFRANAEDKPAGGSAATGFCPSCGTRVAESDARFCQSCGAAIPR